MPEQPNYLAEVNNAIASRRAMRRRLADSPIDPMESAAAMDRMQGTNVSTGDLGTGAEEYDNGPIRLASWPGRRRGGAVANMFSGGGEEYDYPDGGGDCANGMCGVPQSQGTVVGMPAETMAVESPSMTVDSEPRPEEAPGDFYRRIARDAANLSVQNRFANPGASAMSYGNAGLYHRMSQDVERNALTRDMFAEQQRLNTEGMAQTKFANETQRIGVDAEAEATRHWVSATKAATPEGRAELLNQSLGDQLPPEHYVSAVVNSLRIPVPTGKKGESAPAAPATTDELVRAERVARQEVYGGRAVARLIKVSTAMRQEALDPNTPDDFGADASVNAALDDLLASYARTGLYPSQRGPGAPWQDIEAAMENDVAPVMMRMVPDVFVSQYQKQLAGMSPEQRAVMEDELRMRGSQYAQSLYDYMSQQARLRYMEDGRSLMEQRGAPPLRAAQPPAQPPAQSGTKAWIGPKLTPAPQPQPAQPQDPALNPSPRLPKQPIWPMPDDDQSTMYMPEFQDPNNMLPPIPRSPAYRAARSV